MSNRGIKLYFGNMHRLKNRLLEESLDTGRPITKLFWKSKREVIVQTEIS